VSAFFYCAKGKGEMTSATRGPTVRDLGQPPSAHVTITPSDSTDLSQTGIRGLLVTSGGTLTVTGINDTQSYSYGIVSAGTYYSGLFAKVNAATTATVLGLV
jgi:hypothetical protein